MEKTRKVKKLAVCALSFLLALGTGASLTACDSGGNASGGADSSGGLSSSSGGAVLPADEKETFTVTFASESGTVYGAQTVEEGKKATLPSIPTVTATPSRSGIINTRTARRNIGASRAIP